MFDPKNLKAEGGYCFLSHSHHDFPRVRLIRNALEEAGFSPLCFYLKCLEEDNEVMDLIYREIDAREWFIYLDSRNARNSKWVQLERNHIAKCSGKRVFTVDLESGKTPEEIASALIQGGQVYVSYAHSSWAAAELVTETLKQHDFRVMTDWEVVAGTSFMDQISTMIENAAKTGCVVPLIDRNYLQSAYCFQELALAKSMDAEIVPVLMGISMTDVPADLRLYPCVSVSDPPSAEDLARICAAVSSVIQEKFGRI